MSPHIELYRARQMHRRLSAAIELEQRQRQPDDLALSQLKRRKLKAKDRLAQLERHYDA